jgi:hypothetical protein
VFFAVAGLFVMALGAYAVIGILDARRNVHLLEQQLSGNTTPSRARNREIALAVDQQDPLAEARFSSSLLSLSKAHLQAQHASPAPEPAEASSLVLVRPPQSKSHVQVL